MLAVLSVFTQANSVALKQDSPYYEFWYRVHATYNMQRNSYNRTRCTTILQLVTGKHTHDVAYM